MMDIFNMLGGMGQTQQQVSQQLGVDPGTAESAIQAALPMLIGALGQNAQQPQGAEALFGALQNDHQGLDIGSVLGAVLGRAEFLRDQETALAVQLLLVGREKHALPIGSSDPSLKPKNAGARDARLSPQLTADGISWDEMGLNGIGSLALTMNGSVAPDPRRLDRNIHRT